MTQEETFQTLMILSRRWRFAEKTFVKLPKHPEGEGVHKFGGGGPITPSFWLADITWNTNKLLPVIWNKSLVQNAGFQQKTFNFCFLNFLPSYGSKEYI